MRGLHQVEVEIGLDLKKGKHLVEHLAMLRGDADVSWEAFHGLEGTHKRSKLNRFGPRAKDK